MTDADRAALTKQIRKAVREEIRIELLLCGLTDIPAHWEQMDRIDLAAHLRELAERLDPKGEHEHSG